MKDFIERLQAKPEHTRRQIAFFSSAGITLVIGAAWFGALATSGSFALAPSSSENAMFGESGSASTFAKDAGAGFGNLLGAVGAAGQGAPGSATITSVGAEVTSTLDRDSNVEERTVIPF